MNKSCFTRLCGRINKRCGFGLVAEESKFRSHNLRRFHATYIKGSALTYEEHSLITNAEIDEMQGRGRTDVQDTYIKTNPLRQKVLYAKIMNNVSLYHEYDYSIREGDVHITVKNHIFENKKLKEKVDELNKIVEEKKEIDEEVKRLIEEYGVDGITNIITGLLYPNEY